MGIQRILGVPSGDGSNNLIFPHVAFRDGAESHVRLFRDKKMIICGGKLTHGLGVDLAEL